MTVLCNPVCCESCGCARLIYKELLYDARRLGKVVIVRKCKYYNILTIWSMWFNSTYMFIRFHLKDLNAGGNCQNTQITMNN